MLPLLHQLVGTGFVGDGLSNRHIRSNIRHNPTHASFAGNGTIGFAPAGTVIVRDAYGSNVGALG